jgi:diacylglycerol kinase (ATP)
MSIKVILNPYSGRWNALKRLEEVKSALNSFGVDYDLAITEAPGHATEIAHSANEAGYESIVIAGGDGTIGEVLNGLDPQNSPDPIGPIGIMPLGTANDFAVNLGLSQDLPEAAKIISNGYSRRVDLGRVNSWVFANNSAVGLEPVVTIYNLRMVKLKGIVRYLIAAIRAILSKREWQMRVSWDNGEFEGLVSLVSVGNNPLTGGLFRTVPDADPTDGLLSFVHGYAPTRRKMFSLLPSIMSGKYVDDPMVHQHHTKILKIRSVQPSPLQADGEIRAEAEKVFNYEILPSRLEFFSPSTS